MLILRLLLLLPLLTLSGCEGLLFFPQQQMLRTPADVGLRYQDVVIPSSDGAQIHAWWLPAIGKAEATVLFAHGNAENISTHLASVYWLPAQNVNVLLIDYRGYGQSSGVPSIAGAQDDIVAGLRWLSELKPLEGEAPVIVLGQSIGASLAGVAVARVKSEFSCLAGVVLDAGFTGYADIAKKVAAESWLTWPFQYPAYWAMPDGEDLVDEIANLAPLPLLLIHGERDAIVPYAHAESLLAAARSPKRLVSYDGGHIDTFATAENRKVVLAFIRLRRGRDGGEFLRRWRREYL